MENPLRKQLAKRFGKIKVKPHHPEYNEVFDALALLDEVDGRYDGRNNIVGW